MPTKARCLKDEGICLSRRGVAKYIRCYLATGTNTRHLGSGGKRKITEDVKSIVDEQMRIDGETTATCLHVCLLDKLQPEFAPTVSSIGRRTSSKLPFSTWTRHSPTTNQHQFYEMCMERLYRPFTIPLVSIYHSFTARLTFSYNNVCVKQKRNGNCSMSNAVHLIANEHLMSSLMSVRFRLTHFISA